MPFDPEHQHRHSIRLKGYDYSQARAYFITLVTHHRQCLFGNILGNEMRLNPVGKMVLREWMRLVSRFPGINLDEFIVIPDHLHGIIVLSNDKDSGAKYVAGPGVVNNPALDQKRYGVTGVPLVAGSIPVVVRAFKSAAAFRYHIMANNNDPLWLRNYYEHIIRDEEDLDRIRRYIAGNPAKG